MGLLTVCAQHYEGLFWLVSFYLFLALLPTLFRLFNAGRGASPRADSLPIRHSLIQLAFFVGLVASVLYVGGTLPAGRFYYEGVEGFFGNVVLKASYQYIYLYLGLVLHLSDRLERQLLALPASLPQLQTLKLLIATYLRHGNNKLQDFAYARGAAWRRGRYALAYMRARVAAAQTNEPSKPKTKKKSPVEAYFRFIAQPLDAYLDEVLSHRKESPSERTDRISRALYLKYG